MKIATTIEDFYMYSKDTIKCIEWASECGFRYLDFSFWIPEIIKDTPLGTDNYKAYLDKILEKCNSLGVKFVQAHAPRGQAIIKDENYQEYLFLVKRSIECCSYLGIDKIVLHWGLKEGIDKQEYLELNKEFYLKFLDYAEGLGVKILTENANNTPFNGYFAKNTQELLELVEYVNHPNLAVCYDVGHGNMFDVPQHEQIIPFNKHLVALHVNDNLKTRDYHVAPFFGSTNFDSVMYGLKEIGYNGYFTLESTYFYTGDAFKTKFGENKLFTVPLELKLKGEKLLYELTKHILVTYDCFSE